MSTTSLGAASHLEGVDARGVPEIGVTHNQLPRQVVLLLLWQKEENIVCVGGLNSWF